VTVRYAVVRNAFYGVAHTMAKVKDFSQAAFFFVGLNYFCLNFARAFYQLRYFAGVFYAFLYKIKILLPAY
jgi:hypothetical protein